MQVGDRVVAARHYPISIDVASLRALAGSAEVAEHAGELREAFCDGDRQLVLRVDRTDPSKNIVRGFQAFATMLEDHPELAGKVSFLALLQPSRQDVPEYADYLAEIGAIVARVNAAHGAEGYQPIDLRLSGDFVLAVAAYTVSDVLMVNALADGMNLVAKEAVVVNRRDSVLALSENTGAHQELGASRSPCTRSTSSSRPTPSMSHSPWTAACGGPPRGRGQGGRGERHRQVAERPAHRPGRQASRSCLRTATPLAPERSELLGRLGVGDAPVDEGDLALQSPRAVKLITRAGSSRPPSRPGSTCRAAARTSGAAPGSQRSRRPGSANAA